MPPELAAMLSDCDTLAQKAAGAVSSAARDIRKEIVYLSGELNIAGSADAREAVFVKVAKRLGKLRQRLDGLTAAFNAGIADSAADATKRMAGSLVRLSKKREQEIVATIDRAGGGNLAATMTTAMNANIVNALRDATAAAFREQAVSGLTVRELETVLRDKWEAAAKDPNALQFVDRSGRVWNTDAYINMNVRTNAMRIYNETVMQDIANTTGGDLVMVSTGGDCNCRLCFPWEGRILSISGKTKGFPTYSEAVASGIFHPNCVHTVSVVDEEWDAEEINLQRQFEYKPDMTKTELDDERYVMDAARMMLKNPGMDAMQARTAVDRVNLETAIRQGLITDKAQAIVDGLTDAQVTALCPNGNPPQFLPDKDNGGESTWHKGSRGGVFFMSRAGASVDALLKISGVGEGVAPVALKVDERIKKVAADAEAGTKPGPKKETDAERLARRRKEVEAFADGYFERASQYAQDVDRFTAAAARVSGELSNVRSGLIEYAVGKGRDAAWVMQHVPQEAAISAPIGDIGRLTDEVFAARQKQGEEEIAVSDAVTPGIGQMDEATLAAVEAKIRRYNASLNKARVSLAKSFEALQRAESASLAKAKTLAAQGRAVVDALVASEDGKGNYKRPTAESMGIDPEAVKKMPVAEAIKATSKLNDGMEAAKLTYDKAEREAVKWFEAEREKVVEQFKPARTRASSARAAIEAAWDEPGKAVKIGERYVADNGLEKDFARFEKSRIKKFGQEYGGMHQPGGMRMDYRTGKAVPETQEEIDKHNAGVYKAFAADYQTKQAKKESAAVDALVVKRKAKMVEADIICQFGDAKGGCGIVADANPSREEKWSIAKKVMERVMSAEVCPKERCLVLPYSGRAYQSGNRINLAASDGVEIYVHEYCHFIEQYNPHVHERCSEFLRMRAERSGTTFAQSLKRLTGDNYRSDEMTLADDFFRPYCGKIYGKSEVGMRVKYAGQSVGKKGAGYDVHATEILSMGVEQIYKNPVGFYEKDREYFDFCINLLQGNL